MNSVNRLPAHSAFSTHAGLWIGVGLFTVALALRLIFATQLIFPPLDDPAFYVQTARHLAEGRGLITDVIWNYFVPFNSVTHPGFEFWMPLASLTMAGSIRIWGDTWLAAQLPGSVCGALLSMLTYKMARHLWPDRQRWAILAALLTVPGAIPVYQSASADSAMLYGLISSSALFVAALSLERQSIRLAGATGLLCGLAYLTRSYGSLLPIGIGLVWLIGLRRDRSRLLKMIGAAVIGLLIVIVPWWLRNLSAFGAIQPVSLLTAASARDYGEWFNYVDLPSMSKLFSSGPGVVLGMRWAALLHDLSVIALITFPFGLLGVPVALLRREPIFRVFAVYGGMVYLASSLIFTVPALTGSFYHSATTFVPWAALGSVVVIRRLWQRAATRRLSVILYAAILALIAGQSSLAWPSVMATSQADRLRFDLAANWLQQNVPAGQPIITNEAHSLSYASGYPALTLPNQQASSIVRQLAERYNAKYIVIFGQAGLYPAECDRGKAACGDRRYAANGIVVYDLWP
jgi:4-amino-4-deoxy-L-arabinose transferase-like glycosyltransferase